MCGGRRLDTNRWHGAIGLALCKRTGNFTCEHRAHAVTKKCERPPKTGKQDRNERIDKRGNGADGGLAPIDCRAQEVEPPTPPATRAMPAGHKRKVDAVPPAWEKQNRFTMACGRIAGRCNQPSSRVIYTTPPLSFVSRTMP